MPPRNCRRCADHSANSFSSCSVRARVSAFSFSTSALSAFSSASALLMAFSCPSASTMACRMRSSAARMLCCANSISCISALYCSLVFTSRDWSRYLEIFCCSPWISCSNLRRDNSFSLSAFLWRSTSALCAASLPSMAATRPPRQGADFLVEPLDLAVHFLQRFQLFQIRMHAGLERGTLLILTRCARPPACAAMLVAPGILSLLTDCPLWNHDYIPLMSVDMVQAIAGLVLGLAVALFHRPVADFILERERALDMMFRSRGFRLPPPPTRAAA